MSIATELTNLQQDITNARTAIVNKGGTVTPSGGSSLLAADITTINTDPSMNDTVTSGDQILSGLTAHSKGIQYTGNIATYGWDLRPPTYPIGGRIFYDDGDNGATYTFYDAQYNAISTQTISGLASAAYYSVSGTPTKDRWYVCAIETLTQGLGWGYIGTDTGITNNTIGSGKTNTNTILTMGVPTDYTPNIWQFIKDKRDNNYNNCNDWFIASPAEQDQLRAAGLVDWYTTNTMLSARESDNYSSYVWNIYSTRWDGSIHKGYGTSKFGFAARAF